MPITPQDDFPHPVPYQAFMTWKENWVFPAIDLDNDVATLIHFSLRPALGEGIFTAKFNVAGDKYRYVGRSPIPPDLEHFVPVRNERLTFEVVDPTREFRVTYDGPDIAADLRYTGRFPPFDFRDGPKPEGESTVGELGLCVFPFNHYEQALAMTGTLTIKDGPRSGEVLAISGFGNRDHSWGWRDDFMFRHHHWVCASFDGLYVQGSSMLETSYPHLKHGGFVSTSTGNVATAHVDSTDAFWLAENEPFPPFDRDVRYAITTVDGDVHQVTAHIGDALAKLYLNARSEDRSMVYQDCQIFCRYTHADGRAGSGVLEVGKMLQGAGIADSVGRHRADGA